MRRRNGERELLGWQVSELRELAFDARRVGYAQSGAARLAHAAGLIEGSAEVLDGLAEGEYAVVPQLERLLWPRRAENGPARRATGRCPGASRGAGIQLDEALHAMRRYHDRLDLDPARLAKSTSVFRPSPLRRASIGWRRTACPNCSRIAFSALSG